MRSSGSDVRFLRCHSREGGNLESVAGQREKNESLAEFAIEPH